MQLSKDRILTTHVGSLPRPPDLLVFLETRERGEESDQQAFEARLAEAVRDVVAHQVAVGIDSVCDGEQSKMSYTFYVRHRLSGIGAAPGGPLDRPPQTGAHRDIADHPDYAARLHAARGDLSRPGAART
jgi:5-methyltetrahydropteroyltriglutamate--homocysteine methyltransferase